MPAFWIALSAEKPGWYSKSRNKQSTYLCKWSHTSWHSNVSCYKQQSTTCFEIVIPTENQGKIKRTKKPGCAAKNKKQQSTTSLSCVLLECTSSRKRWKTAINQGNIAKKQSTYLCKWSWHLLLLPDCTPGRKQKKNETTINPGSTRKREKYSTYLCKWLQHLLVLWLPLDVKQQSTVW